MPDTKISALTDGAAIQDTDALPLARSGTNVKLTGLQLKTTFAILGTNSFTGTQTITPPVGSSALVVASTIQTTSQPVLDLAQTWNAGGVTFTGLRLNVTNTASAAASRALEIQISGATEFSVGGDGITRGSFRSPAVGSPGTSLGGTAVTLSSASTLQWNSGDAIGAGDVVLRRDGAAGILAQRNGTAAQTLRVYNTWTDASNGEWGAMMWSSNVLEVGTFKNGAGVLRDVYVRGQQVRLIGDNCFFAAAGGVLSVAIVPGGNGVFSITDNSVTDFGRMRLGGSTSAYPAIKRSAATVQIRLADDSGFADVQVRSAIENPPASLTFSTNGQYGVEMTSNTAGNLVYRGSDGTTRRCALVFV